MKDGSRRVAAVFFLVVCTGSGVAAQEPSGKEGADLATLLRILAEDDFAARERATRDILAMGPEIATRIRAARAGLPLEARLRIDAILGRLEASRAILPDRFEDAPLDAVLEQFSEAAGAVVRLADARSGALIDGLAGAEHRRISARFASVPFFEALDRLCTAEGLSFRRDYRDGSFVLQPSEPSTAPVIYHGPLRITPSAFSVTKSTRFLGATVSSANLQVRIDYEDRARIIGLLGPVAARSVVDDAGNELLRQEPAAASRNRYLMAAGNRRQMNVSLQLKPPPEEVEKIARIELPLPVIVPDVVIEGVLRDLGPEGVAGPDAPAGGAGDGIDLRLDGVQQRADQTTLTISFVAPTVESDGPASLRVNWEEIEVRGPDGEVLRPVSSQRAGARLGRQSRVITVASKKPMRLIVRCLARYRVRTVDVVIENVAVR